jgi:hypothetical protein
LRWRSKARISGIGAENIAIDNTVAIGEIHANTSVDASADDGKSSIVVETMSRVGDVDDDDLVEREFDSLFAQFAPTSVVANVVAVKREQRPSPVPVVVAAAVANGNGRVLRPKVVKQEKQDLDLDDGDGDGDDGGDDDDVKEEFSDYEQ